MKRFFLMSIVVLAVTTCFGQFTRLPYFNSFENPQDTIGWTFKKRANATGFAFGDAVHSLGSKSMYISPDSGATATYISTSMGYVSIAYKSFTLRAGTYTLAFDYMCGGDGTNQDMKVAWAPASTSLAASTRGSSYPNAITLNQISDTSGNNTFYYSTWKHITCQITVPTGGGSYNLCFAFRCNGSIIVPPGACIDNIQIDTIHSTYDCSKSPENIAVTSNPAIGAMVSWNGNATEYELMASSISDNRDTTVCIHRGIMTNSDTILYSELRNGQHMIYVRSICGTDTSAYSVLSDVLIYDKNTLCIDYVDYTSSNTVCRYGSNLSQTQNVGALDYGSRSANSRHTKNTRLGETDSCTLAFLKKIPDGEYMSARLGNWTGQSEWETITYTLSVPTSCTKVLLLKYAVVMNYSNTEDAAEFRFEILDSTDNVIGSACENIYCNSNDTVGENYRIIKRWDNLDTIVCRDWSTILINLSQYSGRTIKLRLTTKDSNTNNHYAYAYFILNCIENKITGKACHDVNAPDGFNYQWINVPAGIIVSTDQTFVVPSTDYSQYVCRCLNKNNSGCYSDLNLDIDYTVPEASFNYELSYSGCMTIITFANTSRVCKIQNGQKQYLTDKSISEQLWSIETQHTDRYYHSMVSVNSDFDTIYIPSVGDTVSITLTTWYDNCEKDTTVVLELPALSDKVSYDSLFVSLWDTINISGYELVYVGKNELQCYDYAFSYPVNDGDTLCDYSKAMTGCDSLKCHICTFEEAYDIVVSSNDTTMGTATGNGRYASGDVITLNANAKPHYHFVSWSNGATTATINVTVISDSTLTAYFEIDKHTITALSNNDNYGMVTGGGEYDYGSTATLVATPNAGCRFVNWNNGKTTSTITLQVTADDTLTANFAIQTGATYTVTVNANNPSMGYVTGGGIYSDGDTATLTATPADNHHFVRWSNGDTATSINIVVTMDTTLTAYFDANDRIYSVTALANYADRGTVTGSGQYGYNSTATLSATPNSGYVFEDGAMVKKIR